MYLNLINCKSLDKRIKNISYFFLGLGTQNQYPIGDLSGKLLRRNNETALVKEGQELVGEYWDTFLPLHGIYSIVHRSLVIYK